MTRVGSWLMACCFVIRSGAAAGQENTLTMTGRRNVAFVFAVLLLACEPGTDPQVGALTVSDRTLPAAINGSPYTASLSDAVSGGFADFIWQLSLGSLPVGLTLSESGIVSGTPTENGTFVFDAAVRSGGSGPKTGRFTISVIDALSLLASTERTFVGARDGNWRCEFNWTVAAIGGRPTDRAYWQASEVEWNRVSDGFRLVTQVSRQDLLDWFGEDQVNFGGVLHIPFWLVWDSPFQATLRIRYSVTPTFRQSTAPSDVDCR